jgi:hypothetical protein
LPIAVRRIARAAIDIIRLTFAREKLGDAAGSPPGPARSASTRGRFLPMLFAIEPLASEPPAPPRPRHPSLVSLVLGREALPVEPERSRRAPHLGLRALVAPEPLPLDPVPPPAPRRKGWLAALFAPESLEDS